MILDALVALLLLAGLLAWLWRGLPRRGWALCAIAALLIVVSGVAVALGRWQAGPGLVAGVVMAALGLLALRSKRQRGAPWISGAALLIASLAALTPIYLFPVFTLPHLTGPHQVGVRDFDMIDAARKGVGQSPAVEARRLFVRVWYPASPSPASRPQPYATREEIDTVYSGLATSFGLPSFFFSHLGLVATHGHTGAPVDGSAGPYPVVFFSHGFYSTATQNTALMEELASRGYVVFSVAHTWDSPTVRFADGSVALAGPPVIDQTSEEELAHARQALIASSYDDRLDGFVGGQVTIRRNQPAFAASIDTWLADRLFLRRALDAGSAPASITDVLRASDFSRVAHTGMSFGGSTSGGACLADPSCVAAINLDGADYHGGVDARMPAPFLMLHSDWRLMPARMGVDGPADPRKAFNDFSYETFASAGQTPDVYRLRVNLLEHLGISDMGLMMRRPVRDLIAGPADGHDVALILNDFVGGFLDRHVRGIENGFPEAAFARHAGAVDTHDAGGVQTWWAAKSQLEQQGILADINKLKSAAQPSTAGSPP